MQNDGATCLPMTEFTINNDTAAAIVTFSFFDKINSTLMTIRSSTRQCLNEAKVEHMAR